MSQLQPNNASHKNIFFEEIDATAITLDIDWAPEEVILHSMQILELFNVKATLFCTHESEVIRN